MIRFLVLFVVLVVLTTPAVGQDSQIGKVKAVRVFVNDQIKDGCLPQPNILQVEAELVLRQAGITVVETDDVYPHQLNIAVVGQEITVGEKPMGSCVAAFDYRLTRHEQLRDGSVGRVTAFARIGYALGPKDVLQQKLRENVNATGSALSNEILKAREK